MFVYSGVLMTIAFISRLPQPFKFPEFVWGHFTGAQMTIEDVYSVDQEFESFMKLVENGEVEEGFPFTVKNSHGENVELFPGGNGMRVERNRFSEYAQMCKKFRLREMKEQLDWLKQGISYFFPLDALFLLSPWELELIVCGDNSVPVAELKKHCRFDQKDKSSVMLWHVLESFSAEERMLFIKFATGRMGLPPPGSRWHSDLTIVWVPSNLRDDAVMPLPTAATCSSTIRIPRYTSEEWMAKKIRAAIVFGVDIDTDRQVDFADIVQLT
jgi:E3 ubiquitin-protein ligase HERC1